MQIPFIGQAYENRSIPVSNQICINWYPEQESPDARNMIVLQSAAGIKIFKDLAISSLDHIRGMHYSEKLQLLYLVSGTTLYDVDINGTVTSRGAIAGADDVIMADNGNEVGIANGSAFRVWNSTTSTLSTVNDSAGGTLNVRDIVYLDGRFILMEDDQRLYMTDVQDAATVTSTNFTDVVANPDDLVGIAVANRRVFCWGTASFDVYFNSPQAAAAGRFPILRVDGAAKVGFGLAGRYAKVVQDDTPFWLSNDGRVYMANGYTPVRISHYGIENSIRKYSQIDDCQATQWTENGHRFVAFSFPAGNETWVYDATQGTWHQRASGLNEKVWNVNYVQKCWDNRYMVGSRDEDKIGELDVDIFTEYGSDMKVRRTSPTNHSNQASLFFNRLELYMQTGNAQAGEDPEVYLRWSDDGGVTWGNFVSAKAGKIGVYDQKIVWYSLGKGKNRVWDLQITDNIPRTLIDVVADVEIGEE